MFLFVSHPRAHLLRHIHLWPGCTSPVLLQTGHVWRGGFLRSWSGPGEEAELRRERPGSSCPLRACAAPPVGRQCCFFSECRWRLPSSRSPRRCAGPVWAPLRRCPGACPARSPWLHSLRSALELFVATFLLRCGYICACRAGDFCGTHLLFSTSRVTSVRDRFSDATLQQQEKLRGSLTTMYEKTENGCMQGFKMKTIKAHQCPS